MDHSCLGAHHTKGIEVGPPIVDGQLTDARLWVDVASGEEGKGIARFAAV